MNLKIISLPCVIIVVVLAGYAVITAGTCWGINILEGALLAKQDKKMKADNDNEDPLARLEAEQQADRAKEQTEISKLEKELASLNAQATRSGNTLDMMLTIVNQRTKLQEQLEKLKIKQKKAEVKRRAAIAGLKKKNKKEDIRKYREIAASPFGDDMKKSALKALIAKYPEMAEGSEIGNKKKFLPKAALGSTINSLGMKLVLIPAGTFMMGSPADGLPRDDDEKQHKVTVSRKFYIQSTEVTQGQWQEIMGSNPSNFKDCGDDCPVERVSWEECQEFILRLNERDSPNTYRLPTEAEWEYVCRSESSTAFADGDIDEKECGHDPNLDQIGWYCGNSNTMTHSVAQKKPNHWGLYDMHGNVWEWCQDWYGGYASGKISDPAGPTSGFRRVLRGGSWLHYAGHCRSANRFSEIPDNRSHNIGFRLVRDTIGDSQ